MAKLSKKAVDKVLEDFKEVLFISTALDNNKVRAFDFFDYLKRNDDAREEFEQIDKFNSAYKEAQIEQKVYSSDFSKPILLEMIKARDKKKYVQKMEFEDVTPMNALSDDELDAKIAAMQAKLGK